MVLRCAISLLIMLSAGLSAAAQNRGNVEAIINTKRVSINYGRPALQGRDMLARAKPGTVWRLGMNEATEIASAGTLVVSGKELKPGEYSLWAKTTGPNAWILAFHPRTGIWGQPELSGFVAELPLKVERIATPVERLTIQLADSGGQAALTIQWGHTQLSGTFDVR